MNAFSYANFYLIKKMNLTVWSNCEIEVIVTFHLK